MTRVPLPSLAQYSDENMMDPYNLAVCFGPTLLPVPTGQDPVAVQGRLNQLVQTLIMQPARVFPPATVLPGPVYEKCMAPPAASCLGYSLGPAWGRGQWWRGAPPGLLTRLPLPPHPTPLHRPRGMQLESLPGELEPEDSEGLPSMPAPGASAVSPSDLEAGMEAVACFAYTGRTAQELTFQRGDVLRLYTRASSDWWRGELGGVRGLIPHKYISLPAG